MHKTMVLMMIGARLMAGGAGAVDEGAKDGSSAGTVKPRVFNGVNYGAVGDDKTDNTGAFSACHINDPDNLGIADINYWVVEGNVGATEKFTRNGGASIRARRIGSAPAGIEKIAK